MMETDKPSACADLREDYFECLHHRKEIGRLNRIGKELEKLKAEGKSPLEDNGAKGGGGT
jgi:NADH dehydrogenase (ubiquinone) Fe-S protein 5